MNFFNFARQIQTRKHHINWIEFKYTLVEVESPEIHKCRSLSTLNTPKFLQSLYKGVKEVPDQKFATFTEHKKPIKLIDTDKESLRKLALVSALLVQLP